MSGRYRMKPHARIVAAAVIAAPAISASACSGWSGKSTGSDGQAAARLKQATGVMSKVTAMHLNLAVHGDVPNLKVTRLDGDISNTPQAVATGNATLLLGSTPTDARFVFLDGHVYSDIGQPGQFTDFGNGASIYNVSVLLAPINGLADVLARLQNAQSAGNEQINGVATTKITGKSSADDIATLAGCRLTAADVSTVTTTVWIASDGSSHLVQLRVDPTSDTSVTLTMSDWGKQVTATRPI